MKASVPVTRPRPLAASTLSLKLPSAGSAKPEQRVQRVARLGRQPLRQRAQLRRVLGRQRVDDSLELRGVDHHAGEHTTHDARVTEVDHRGLDAGRLQPVEREFDHLEVGLEPAVAVDLGAELQRLSRRVHARRPGVQNRTAVAQARHALAVEQVRIDARDLRRRVGTHAQRAPAELVDQLEGAQVQRVTGARQQRFEVLEQRRHHQLEAVAAREIEQVPAHVLDAPRLGGQHVGDVLGQQPGRRHAKPVRLKRALYRAPRARRPHLQRTNTSASSAPSSMLASPMKRI